MHIHTNNVMHELFLLRNCKHLLINYKETASNAFRCEILKKKDLNGTFF